MTNARAMTNALQAVLDRAVAEQEEATVPAAPEAAPRARRTAPRRAPPQPAADEETKPEASAKSVRSARAGKRFVGAHFDPEVARQLKMLAAEDDKTIQELLQDAVDLLFIKAGKARIAEIVKKP